MMYKILNGSGGGISHLYSQSESQDFHGTVRSNCLLSMFVSLAKMSLRGFGVNWRLRSFDFRAALPTASPDARVLKLPEINIGKLEFLVPLEDPSFLSKRPNTISKSEDGL